VIDRREDLPSAHAGGDFDEDTMDEAAMMKGLRKKRAEKEPSDTVYGSQKV
jgi:hypothetical protein